MKNNLFAAVSYSSNRAFAIFDSGDLPKYRELTGLKIIEVGSIGSATINLKENGSCNTVSISPVGSSLMKDDYHIIKVWSNDSLSLGEVYKLIEN